MARFTSNGDITINISPNKFVANCSDMEFEELKSLIFEQFDIDEDDFMNGGENIRPRSFGQMKYFKSLKKLKSVWYSISKTDGDIIEEIAKKYE